MVYLWRIPQQYPNKYIGQYLEQQSRDRFVFRQGMPINVTGEIIKIKFECSLDELSSLGCLCNSSRIPLIAPDVVNLLQEHAAEDVQFFDTIVEASDGETDRYKLVNFTKKVTAIDQYNSELERYMPDVDVFKIHKLVLLPNCMKNTSIARIFDDLGQILVSKKLAGKLFELNKLGIGLYTPHEIYPSIKDRVF